MLELPFRRLWQALAFMFCAGLVAAAWGHPSVLRTEIAAAWFQAVGIPISIFVGIWLHQRSEAFERQKAESARIDSIRSNRAAYAQIAAEVFQLCKRARNLCKTRKWNQARLREYKGNMEGLLEYVNQINFLIISKEKLSTANAFRLRNICIKTIEKLDYSLAQLHLAHPQANLFDTQFKNAKDELLHAKSLVSREP